MTFSKNFDNGEGTIILSQEEQRQFELGNPICGISTSRKGITETEVKRRIACPNEDTRHFLREINKILPKDQMTVKDVMNYMKTKNGLSLLQRHRWTISDIDYIFHDLNRYTRHISGDTPITEIMQG